MNSWRRVALVLLCLFGLGSPAPLLADWSDWWRTTEQQAADALKRGDIQELQRVAPNADWQAIGAYESGNYDEAARQFGRAATDHVGKVDPTAERRALYNQGVSQVRNGQYQEAIDNFKTVLQSDPAFNDAEHNLNIAEKLLQLQQQQQQQSDSQQGDGNQDNEQNGQQQPQNESAEQQPAQGEQSPSSDEQQSQGQSSSESDQTPNGAADQQSDDAPTAPTTEQEQLDAQQALAAEAERERDNPEQGESGNDVDSFELPMTEADQAAEQLLRQIPDDPAGLLRRKLLQSHRSQYPEVGDAQQPW
ncbi:MAG: tetratricopeptide repeat protein [Granulosicoccus sp.]|nr:tetratricopeptide repeat protein [Granulosicoccus sp.]